MFAKHKRDKFCSIMDKYWSRFASNWDVLLHGSPAVDMYGGMKLAAGGELGMGVGEEDWGSSERDVLEDFARRTEGLVDVMVSRFDEASPLQILKDSKPAAESEIEPWLGSGKNPNAADGVVFSGLGALSHKSLRDLSHWVESIYCYGDQAYGIRDNPTSDRKRRKRRNLEPPTSQTPEATNLTRKDRPQSAAPSSDSGLPTGIPPPIVRAVESSLDKASAAVERGDSRGTKAQGQTSQPMLASLGDSETWMKYMTLGYGTAWGGKKAVEETPSIPQQAPRQQSASPEPLRYVDPEPDVDLSKVKLDQQLRQEREGYFLVGLKGDMADADADDENDEGNWNNRILLRTLYVEANRKGNSPTQSSGDSDVTPVYEREWSLALPTSPNGLSRLRPVVYVVCCSCFLIMRVSANRFVASPVHIHVSFQPSYRCAEHRYVLP
jgi:hypothetical protein